MKKLDKLPAYLLGIGFVLVILVFGVMTLVSGGGEIVDSAKEGYIAGSAEGVFEGVSTGISSVEAEYNLVFYRKYDFVTLNGMMKRVMGKQLFPDSSGDLSMIKLNDGMLTKLKYSMDAEICRENLVIFRDYLAELDIPLVFTYVHTKILDPEAQLPLGASDTSGGDADSFLALLDELGIDYVDTREVLKATGLPATDLYYATDTHWTVPAAFYVYQALAEKLNAEYGFTIDPYVIDEDNYTFETYKQRFLGSYGRQVGVLYSGLDDFTTILPKFDTYIYESTQDNDDIWEYREGPFLTSVLHPEHLECDEGENYSTHCYSMYGYNRGEVLYENPSVDDGRLLLIKNSSGNPITDFFTLGVRNVCGLDRRALLRMTIAEYVAEYKPEAVVIVYNYDFLKPERLDFFTCPETVVLE